MAKLLIVEDEAHIVRVMDLWLTRHGHRVLHAPNGRAALEVLDREQVDLIITDVNMPHLDGIGLVKVVREERKLELPIVILTARCDQPELATRLKPYGVRLHPKPFIPSRLVAEIDSLLKVPAH